mmetsp:Transcript_3246/g.7591  ORF Transcript_3246/g.7591 Transcript_3246/m.7591 type:complete len:346 (-) Transcript_3246:169-1206(-)
MANASSAADGLAPADIDIDDYDYQPDPDHPRSHRRYDSSGRDRAEMEAYPLCDKLFCPTTVWDTVPVGQPRRGYWGPWPGPGMALENTCESDYLYSRYVAQFWCMLACLVIFLSGVVGLWLTRKVSGLTPARVLFVNLSAVGFFGIFSHTTQWRFWEALELIALEHFTAFVALLSGVLGWGLRSNFDTAMCLKGAILQLLVLSPSLYFGNAGLESAVAICVAVAQVSMVRIWVGHRSIWERFPKAFILATQFTVGLCVLIDLSEMFFGCEWEVQMDYNGNVLNDPNIHNHLHAASLVAMACAMYLAICYLDFSYFALKDSAMKLKWVCGMPFVAGVDKGARASGV